ncbi:MAG: PP2C family serine/threonine-protein phosphatase [Planctomycetota bacterium]
MKLPAGIEVGVSSHTGLVRRANEDDYLLALPAADAEPGLVIAIADGMGGVAGGAEASRTALRALGSVLVDGATAAPVQRMQLAFRAASAKVFEAATAVPVLRDMGTTLTALWLTAGGVGCIGHVGDTRLYRVREREWLSLTEDHVAKQGESLLTRCVGGGQASTECDAERVTFASGDRYVLVSDGVWNVVAEDAFAAIVTSLQPCQVLAERLVQAALDAGAPDNATAVVVDVLSTDLGDSRDVELPQKERPDARRLWPRPRSLRTPLWAWLLLSAAILALAWVALRAATGVEPMRWLLDRV